MKKLLFLHGALGSKVELRPLMDKLKSNFEVYAFDFDGHGENHKNSQFSIPLFAENLTAFIKEKEIEGCHVFGYSMGGYVALYLASHSNHHLGKIVTFGTKFNWNKESATREAARLNPGVIEEKVPVFSNHLHKVHGDKWKVVVEQTAKMMIKLGNRPLLDEMRLNKISNPVLVCIGDQDKMVSIEESIAVTQQIKQAKKMVLSDFEHVLAKNDLDKLAEKIIQFIGK